MDNLINQIGYLILKDDGAVLESGGDLENDEKIANIFLDLINLTESIDDRFMPNSSCERVSLVYEDHSYNLCMSNRRIYIAKLRNIHNNREGMTDSGVFAEAESSVPSTFSVPT